MIDKQYRIYILIVALILISTVIIYVKIDKSILSSDDNSKKTKNLAVDIYSENSNLITFKQYTIPGCPACSAMEGILKELKEEYNGKINIVEVNAYKNVEESKKYNIEYTPTQIFFNKDGSILYRHVGYMTRDELIKVFKDIGVNND